MIRILIPDAGPLFSLAAADILAVLLSFRIAITDVVKQESIDKGSLPRASIEAKRLWSFYQANSGSIELRETQFGKLLAQARAADPSIRVRNAGELSIQSLLIELREEAN